MSDNYRIFLIGSKKTLVCKTLSSMRKTQVLRIDDRILALFLKLLCYFFYNFNFSYNNLRSFNNFRSLVLVQNSFLFLDFKICLYVHFLFIINMHIIIDFIFILILFHLQLS